MMAKSTLDSLEKLLVKFITPIDQKFTIVMKELKKLEDKIDKLESKKLQTPNDAGTSNSPATAVSKPAANVTVQATNTATGDRTQRTRGAKRPTHTLTASNTIESFATPPPPSQSTRAPVAPVPSASRSPPRSAAQAVTPLRRPPPAQPLAPSVSRLYDNNVVTSNDDAWHVVRNKTKRQARRRAVITGIGSTDNDLQTVERVRKIHACFFKPETTSESIITYMNKINPTTNYNADKIKLAHNYYSSFAITVPCSKFDFFMMAENWPPGTEISEWFRRSDGRAGSTSTYTRQASRRKLASDSSRRDGAGSTGSIPGSACPFDAATSTGPRPRAL